MKNCEFCGDKLEDKVLCNCEKTVAKTSPNEMFKKYKFPIIMGAVAFLLLFVLFGIFAGTSKKNPFDYTEVSFSGYNTNGRITVNFDSNRLVEDILGEEPDDLEKAMAYYEKYDELETAISYNVSAEEGLSNGDTVTIEFLVMPSSSSKVKACKENYTVSGLTEVETVDVFKDLEVSFEGMNGEGEIKIDKTTDDEFVNALEISTSNASQNFTLSNGDEVEVIITCSNSVAEKYGKVPAEKSGVFTVSGLSEYATVDDLPMDIINNYAARFLEEETPENIGSTITYSNVKIYGIYFAENKGKAFTNKNELHILISYNEYAELPFGQRREDFICKPLIFENIVKNSDGTVVINYKDGSGTGLAYNDVEKYLSELEVDYTVTKVD